MEKAEFFGQHTLESENLPALGGVAKHSETKEYVELSPDRFERAEGFAIEGVYEHYKSHPQDLRLYYAHFVVKDLEANELLVIYENLYGAKAELHMRPAWMFFDEVDVEGKNVPRFKPLKPVDSGE